jgi:hypothetical protein
MRRRRVWAGIIGAVIGWGIAGLDGGIAGSVHIPAPRIDFAAAGTQTSPVLGTVAFGLARSGQHVHQVVTVANDRVEMVFDRTAAHVTIIDNGKVSVEPTGGTSSLLYPFSRAQQAADAPLQIVRDGKGSHLGIPCERFRAIGTSSGKPLRATACITADGIPLVTAIRSAHLTVRTEITEIDFNPPDPASFLIATDLSAVETTRR